MTIAHRLRRTGNLEFNRAAKAASDVTHDFSPFVLIKSGRLSGIGDGGPVHELYCVVKTCRLSAGGVDC